jgi:colanic acid/amylovoran biosynthesis glycosyltransferase
MEKKMNKVLLFSNHLLPYSETFIRSQGENLSSFTACYLGSNKVLNGIDLPKGRAFFINNNKFGKVIDIAFKSGVYIRPVLDLVKKQRPDIIHAHFGPNGFSILPVANKLNIPLVVTFHGFDLIKKPTLDKHGRLHLRFFKHKQELAFHAQKFIAVSDFIKRRLMEFGFSESKIIRHYIGIDTDKFKPDPQIKRENIILCVARMTLYKGHRYLISAMFEIEKNYPDFKLVLVGDGAEKKALEKQARELGINVEFTGRQTPDEVIHWMRKSKIYVQPSICLDDGQEEALALTIVEAQAVGTPAIVFKSGGMPEAIQNEKTGFVVEEKSIRGLTEKIANIIDDQELWRKFSQEAIQFANENHNLKKQTEKLQLIYSNIISEYKGIK